MKGVDKLTASYKCGIYFEARFENPFDYYCKTAMMKIKG